MAEVSPGKPAQAPSARSCALQRWKLAGATENITDDTTRYKLQHEHGFIEKLRAKAATAPMQTLTTH
jgi:hypothetical protein